MMTNLKKILEAEPQYQQIQTLERKPNTKTIAVVMAAAGNSITLAIEPGTTPRDIRKQLNLDEGFILTNGRGAEAFGDDENLYPLVPDGAKLYASTPVEVGSSFSGLLRQLGLNIPTISPPRGASDGGNLLSFLCGLSRPSSDKVRIVRRPHEPSTVPVVQRETAPYWQERGWHCSGWYYTGYYRSRFGTWKGRAQVGAAKFARLFIHSPPEFLRKHPHWVCFHERPGEWYFIHMTDDVDLSSGILRVEALLNEAFREAHT